MYLKELWRYPVKSLRGEELASASVGESGIDGDRRVYVTARGRVITARTHPALLAVQATLDDDGEARIAGDPWDAPASLDVIRAVAGPDAELVPAPIGAFDVLPLSVATDGAVGYLGIDGRRLRPNLVIGGVDGLRERDWPGRRLLIGDVVIHIARLRPRCVMTTWDPDTQVQDRTVLRRIVHELEGTTALDCAVEQPGLIEVGAQVRLH